MEWFPGSAEAGLLEVLHLLSRHIGTLALDNTKQYVRHLTTPRLSYCEKHKPREQSVVIKMPCAGGKKKTKEKWGTGLLNEHVILELWPPSSGAQLLPPWIRNKPLSQGLPEFTTHALQPHKIVVLSFRVLG